MFPVVPFGMAILPPLPTQTAKGPDYRRTAYFLHKALAVAVSINFVMALSAFHQSRDVVGGYVFMLIIGFGIPLLLLFCASLYYSFRARSDRRLIVLSAASLAMAVSVVLGIEPTLESLVMDCIYVVSVVWFSVLKAKQDRGIRSTGIGGEARGRQSIP